VVAVPDIEAGFGVGAQGDASCARTQGAGFESPQEGASNALSALVGGNGQDPQGHLRPGGREAHGGAYDRTALLGNQQQFAFTGVGGFEVGETPLVGVIDSRVELGACDIKGGG
jgi:hypothetical protein